MATNHFHAVDPRGVVHTRTSKTKVYSHTVVEKLGRVYAAVALAHSLADMKKQAPKDYAFYQSMVDRSWHYVGGKVGGELRFPTITDEASMAKESAEYADRLAGRSLEQFVEDKLQAVRDHYDAQIDKGFYDCWHNKGWCSRLDLAQKLAAQSGWLGRPEATAILEARPGKAPVVTA